MKYGFICQPISNGVKNAENDFEIVAYEILVREILGDRPSISSASVLAWAHAEMGRLREIDRDALELAIASAPSGIPHHVNVGLETIEDWAYFAELGKALLDRMDPRLIVLEISEAIDPMPESVTRWISQIKSMGFPVILDDFGRHHSNNHALMLYRPDGIKIDGEIIRGILDPHNLKIIEKDIKFCQQADLFCVAEHVQSEAIFEELVKLCDRLGFTNLLYQGWHIGKGELCGGKLP